MGDFAQAAAELEASVAATSQRSFQLQEQVANQEIMSQEIVDRIAILNLRISSMPPPTAPPYPPYPPEPPAPPQVNSCYLF
jgi:hypothetical protein